MKNILTTLIIGCVLLDIIGIILGYVMFDFRVSCIVFSCIISTIVIFEGFRSLNYIDNKSDMRDENDDI